MDDKPKSLTEAWARQNYGPFLTRDNTVINIVEKHHIDGFTSYLGDNDEKYFPSGCVRADGLEHPSDIVRFLISTSKDIRAYRSKAALIRGRKDARLLHLQNKVEEQQAALRRYIKETYPIGCELLFVFAAEMRAATLVKHRQTYLEVLDLVDNKLRAVKYKRIVRRIKIDDVEKHEDGKITVEYESI